MRDAPWIRWTEQTGYPEEKQYKEYYCPICNRECRTIYYASKTNEVAGCEHCISEKDANEYFEDLDCRDYESYRED